MAIRFFLAIRLQGPELTEKQTDEAAEGAVEETPSQEPVAE